MPGIAAAGTKIQGLGVTGDNAQGVALGGSVIFRSYLPVGTVLWNGNAYYTEDANITLNAPISNLKTGIMINATNDHETWWQFDNVHDPNNPPKYESTGTLEVPVHEKIPLKSMENGKTYDVRIGQSYSTSYIRFTKVSDTVIKVGYSPRSSSVYHGYGGTTYYDSSSNYPQAGSVNSVIIASITAY